MHVGKVDEPGLVLLEVEVNINEIVAIGAFFGNIELKTLLVPSFANPANILEFLCLETGIFPWKNDVVTADILGDDGMQCRRLFLRQFQEPLRVDIPVVSSKMKPINLLIFLKSLCDDGRLFNIKIIV